MSMKNMSVTLKTGKEIESLIAQVKTRKRSKKRQPFSVEFRQSAVRCWRASGLSKNKFGDTIGVSDSLLYNWNKQYPLKNNVVAKSVDVDVSTKVILGAVRGHLTAFESGTRVDVQTGESNIVCAATLLQLLEKKGDAN